MFPLAFCNELLASEEKSLQEQCEIVSSIGYTGLEIAPATLGAYPHKLGEKTVAALHRTIAESGLKVVGLHWLLSTYPTLSITDGTDIATTIQVLEGLTTLCAGLGGKIMVHGSPQQRLTDAGNQRSAFRVATEIFKHVADHAAQCNVIYCIEPLDPSQTRFINSVEQGVELADAVGNPAFMTMIDTSSTHRAEEKPVADVIQEWLPTGKIGHIHLNDSNRGAPGTGDDPFSEIVLALVEGGWNRLASIEPFRIAKDATTTARIGYSTISEIQLKLNGNG